MPEHDQPRPPPTASGPGRSGQSPEPTAPPLSVDGGGAAPGGGSEPPPRAGTRRRALRWAIDIAVVLAIVFAVQAWRTRDVPDGVLPDVTVHMLDGRVTRLSQWQADHPDSPYVLYFWADWCPICRTVEGTINALDEDWPVLTVAMQSGDAANVARHLRERNLDWHTALDEHGQLAARFGIRGVPTMLVIDADGRRRFAEVGLTSATGMRLRLWWASHIRSSD
mgnify:CR=1 FL=1